jgi:hypothetical protein
MCLPVTAIVMILLNSYCSKEISRAKSLELISIERTASRLPIEHHVQQASVQEAIIEAPGW